MTKHRWNACNDGECTCGYINCDDVFALKVIGKGDDVDPYLLEVDRRDLIRRVTALLNMAEGIPTDTLDSGVVVVPVEVAERAAREVLALAHAHEISGFERDAEELRSLACALSPKEVEER